MWLTTVRGEGLGDSKEITSGEITIGREPGCEILVPDARASRRHATVSVTEDGGLQVEDLGSSNGTFVDEQRITEATPLSVGARLRIGDTVFRVDAEKAGFAATEIGSAVPPPPPPAAGTGAGPGGPTPSTIERRQNRRTARLALIVGGGAAAAAIVVGILAVTGVFSGSGDDDGDEPDIPEIVDAARPSTLEVATEAGGQPIGSGTGWVLDADEGLIVTNAHVTNGGDGFTVALDGEGTRDATLLSSAPCDDLSILRVEDTSGLETMPIASQSDLRQGETVIAVGFPGAAANVSELTATTGVVSVVETTFDVETLDIPNYSNVIQTDTAINPGNSGGPLVNTGGGLVGVNSAGIDVLGGRTIQGQGYAIGENRLAEVLPDMREGRSLAWTGMNFFFPTEDAELEQLGFSGQVGIVVDSVVPGTNAAAAGFGQDPVLITAVDGQAINNTLPSYCDAVGDAEAGEQITFTVFEQGDDAPQDVRVTVQDAAG